MLLAYSRRSRCRKVPLRVFSASQTTCLMHTRIVPAPTPDSLLVPAQEKGWITAEKKSILYAPPFDSLKSPSHSTANSVKTRQRGDGQYPAKSRDSEFLLAGTNKRKQCHHWELPRVAHWHHHTRRRGWNHQWSDRTTPETCDFSTFATSHKCLWRSFSSLEKRERVR